MIESFMTRASAWIVLHQCSLYNYHLQYVEFEPQTLLQAYFGSHRHVSIYLQTQFPSMCRT